MSAVSVSPASSVALTAAIAPVVRSHRGLSDMAFRRQLAARRALHLPGIAGLPPELFLPSREDFGPRDTGLNWRGCPDMPRSAKTLVC